VARTQTPTATNYDIGSTTWVDLRRAPLQSAIEVTSQAMGLLDHSFLHYSTNTLQCSNLSSLQKLGHAKT
ncbi:hypothetical protein Lal_00042263, partial [Lupinus albus]